MDNRQLDLGLVASVHAESFGEPGQRTFRLIARTEEGEVAVWVEKEQLVMVGSAIDEVLRRVPQHFGREPDSDLLRSFVGELEVHAGALAVGYDGDHSGYSIEASEFASQFDLTSISLLARRQDFEALSKEIGDILAASRPRCVLCGSQLTGEPHFCPPSNGHTRVKVGDA
jgi:uncharacterized repeat protein (TIGR03847 family)